MYIVARGVLRKNFEQLQPGVRADVRADVAAIHNELRHIRQGIFEVGRRLVRIKEHVMHGQFMAIVAKDFPEISQTTATRWINVHEQLSRTEFCSLQNSQVQATTLYALTRPSTSDAIRYEIVDALPSDEIKTTRHWMRKY